MTDKTLYKAFDLQRFAENERLRNVIEATHRRLEGRELEDEELDLVAAAGEAELPKKPKELRQ